MKERIRMISIVTSLIISLAVLPAWGVPSVINYQGKLADQDGYALTGTYDMTFSIYDSITDGNLLWSENQSAVKVLQGIYNIKLGSETPFPADLFEASSLYLEVAIYNTQTSSYETLSPRQEFTSVAFSIKSGDSDSLDGFDSKDFMHVGDKATGDLYGSYPSPIVAGLRGKPISWTAPLKGQILKYNGFVWVPDKDADSGGDITRVIAGEGLTGGAYSGDAILSVASEGITSEHILDGTITAVDIAPNGITSDRINSSGLDADTLDGYNAMDFLTSETDPTVASSVKDGVSWDEVSAKPAGFADNIDNDTVYNAGTGLDLSGTTFNVRVPLYLVGNALVGGIIKGINSSTSGYGVYGAGNTGVYGLASEKGNFLNYGGFFRASGDRGHGVHGFADATGAVTNYGGYFVSAGMSGRAVYGEATNDSTGENFGGYFKANGINGAGVYGSAPYRGVYGVATSTTSSNYGGYFLSRSASGRGVCGASTMTGDVQNFGGYFSAYGDRGIGLYARGPLYAGYFQGNVIVSGNLAVMGTKQFVVPHPKDSTKEIVYVCLEGGENGVYVRGSGTLEKGRARISLPEHFSLVASEKGLTVQITPRDGKAKGYLYAEKVTPEYIFVVEVGGGESSASFDYLVMGIRAGFERHRVIRGNIITKGAEKIGD